VWPARFLIILGAALAVVNYLILAAARARAWRSGAAPPPVRGH
jgi:hypothetical protein